MMESRHLASGSDDTNVILWDPFKHKQLQVIPTTHIGNIFSVKFLGSVSNLIATAAGDCRVLVQSIETVEILDCVCHVNRVKRLATSPEEPNLFWSAGEDGLVMQFDLREQHECSWKPKPLIDLSSGQLEVKCVAINPTKPYCLAVGVNDCYIRMYDRRMIKSSVVHQTIESGSGSRSEHILDKNCVQYYAPGHLAIEYSNVVSYRLAATYISFNAAGSEMLVNMGGEQIYLFNVNNPRHINEMRIPQVIGGKRRFLGKYRCKCPEGNGFLSHNNVHKSERLSENCACYYMRRAYKCFRRRWVGDVYSAARDYLRVITNWPDQYQAYVGLIKCLISMKWAEDAQQWMDYFLTINPDSVSSNQVKKLQDSLNRLKTCSKKKDDDPNLDKEEVKRRLDSRDYELRFLGHCNTTTDIKEANFLGEDGNYICAGSDEGIILIWERKKSNIVSALFGDFSIVNCIQPHPTACLIASSGIDPVVKLWSPMPENGTINPRIVKDINSVVETNQRRMAMDPFESMLVNMGYRIHHGAGSETEESSNFQEMPNCRTC
ncbi:WD and tetratricopeptide repeats protein 1-like isoform X2 [Cylas formicarius]|uniref:WD and tetratricopeptide repeats protein 1-like isoform X2 n=1 Tax=Cylas formicarius TaxID=197179 RepID=UPI002958DF24|nr:WD and tetratricopeptide repeats protein 1-like isoform X2 [Cylas formicarius]